MKFKKLFVIGVAALSLATVSSQAQTATNTPSSNGLLTDIGNVLGDVGLTSNPTNLAIVPFGGISLTGNKLAAGLLGIEDVNNNVGIVGGVDHLWLGGKTDNANLVSGGLTLKAAIYPVRDVFSFIGQSLGTNTWAYNFKATPYAVALIGTPVNGTSNDGGLCAINRAGVDCDIYSVGGWNMGAGFDFGNRTGAGNYSGNYIDFIFSVSKGF